MEDVQPAHKKQQPLMPSRKEYDYVVSLKKPDTRLVDFISILLCIITLFIFTYLLLRSNYWIGYIIGIVLQLILFIVKLIAARNNQIVYFRNIFFVAFVTWIVGPYSNAIIAILYLLAAFAEMQVKFSKEIGVDEQGLTFNTIITKSIPWQKLQNVVLKDDIITIDQKNNKLIQKETDATVADDMVTEFNDYCSRHIQPTL